MRARTFRSDKKRYEVRSSIAYISRLATKDAFSRGSLVPISTPGFDLGHFFNFLWHKQKSQTNGIQEFLSLCRRFTADVNRSDLVNSTEIA